MSISRRRAHEKTEVATSEFMRLRNYIFGSTAAIVTNISLIVGLGSARAGKGPIIGSLLTIALADNVSDSLGIHMYKETEGVGTRVSLLATALNFVARLLVSLTFVGIVLFLSVRQYVPVAIAWSLVLLALTSYLVARRSGQSLVLETAKHLVVVIVAVGISWYVGLLIAEYFL
jgi:hypothetical protein